MLLSFWAVYFTQGNWGQDNELFFKSEHFQPLCIKDVRGNAKCESSCFKEAKRKCIQLTCRNKIAL